MPKAAAAAAGVGSSASVPATPEISVNDEPQEIDLSDTFISASVKATLKAAESEPATAYMSSAVAEPPEVETFEPQADEDAPHIAVDPMMAESAPSSSRSSFSEISELPPLKKEEDSSFEPPPPPTAAPVIEAVKQAPPKATMYDGMLPGSKEEKPKVQPREVAEKAIKEIKSVPPKLMMYALGGAGALILAIGIGVTIYIHGLNADDDAGSKRTAAADTAPQMEVPKPAPKKADEPTPVQPAESEPEPAAPVATKSHAPKKKATAPAPAIIPGQLAIDSTPQGAQVQLDGRTDPSWVTPFALTNLQPGQHSITVSKPGFSTDTRAVEISSGNRTTTVIHLAQLMATLIVRSDPQGANIYVDGRDVGAKTPAQVSIDKGQHVVLVRMPGYIDETMNAQFVLGQTFNFAPTLRSLGNTDNIKTVGKMSKLFGGKGVPAGQGVVSIHTQPKGAQIAINQHILDKNSPVDVALDPGNYVLDITLTGFAPIHKVITVDKGGKVAVDEAMQKQ